ncbi:hypothetical protein DXG01_005676 [Tephrocybe rancida]|nr:hypothetical protein DXG01_005676 [Tephrocybe rancida]
MALRLILHLFLLREKHQHIGLIMISGKRICTASSRITDTNNVGEIILSSHHDAHNANIDAQYHLEAGQDEDQAVTTVARPTVPLQAPIPAPEPAGNPSTSAKRKSPPVIEINSDPDSDAEIPQPRKRKKKGQF